jgi:hypothetical protein
MQQPSVGRIVHYVSHGTPQREDGTQAFASECRAAVITEATPPRDALYASIVSLAVLNPEGMFFNRGVPFDDGGANAPCTHLKHGQTTQPEGGTWHWPEG